ncbi:MAG: LAGLIDADG family homing endonuclease [Candidatus Thorarchaeota archaeon]|jgi:intein/homing endonuclease
MKVLFVGPVSGYTSYPVVSKGILRAFIDAGINPIVADTTWDGSPDHTEPYFEQVPELIDFLAAGQVFELVNKGILPNETIRHCVSINPSNQLMKIKENKVAMMGMFVGDVDRIPESWKELMEQQDLVLTPSTWGRQVIQDAGVGRPIMVLNHGISEVFRLPEQNVECGENFVFFHPSSAAFYPERKGTPQVLKAFERLVLEEKDVSLKLIFGMKSKPVRELLRNLPDAVKKRLIVQFLAGARSQDSIRRVYVTSHAGVFPSRAEGFGLCLEEGTLVTTKKGVVPIQEVSVGDVVLTHTGSWKKVLATKKRDVRSRLIRIKCQGIPDIGITKKHVVLAASRGFKEQMPSFRDNNHLSWMEASRLDEKCYLAIRPPFIKERSVQISLVKYSNNPIIDGDNFTSRYSNSHDGYTASDCASEIGVTIDEFRRAVYPSSAKASREETRRKREKINKMAEDLGYFDNRKSMPCSIDITPEFCRVLGYYAAEGSIGASKDSGFVQFSFSQVADSIPISHIIKFMEGLGVHCGIYNRKDGLGRNINCSSSIIVRLFSDICKGDANTKRLPDFIWELSKECRAAILEALCRGDGCNSREMLEYYSSSAALAFQARDLWLSLGIPASIKKKKKPQRHTNSTTPVKCHGKIRYSSRYGWSVRVHGSYYEEAIRLIGMGKDEKERKTDRTGTHFVKSGDYWLVPIREIRHGRTTKPVYDLQVEEDESFIANGIVVHNCPLEMRACGVPVVQTFCTGHRDHMDPDDDPKRWGIVEVKHGDMVPAWGKFGRAPEVLVEEVYQAMLDCINQYSTLQKAAVEMADAVQAQWSWQETTAPLIHLLLKN